MAMSQAIENYKDMYSNEPEYDGEYRVINHNPYTNMKSTCIQINDDAQFTKKPKIKVLVNFKKKES